MKQTKTLLHIKVLNQNKHHDVWIDDSYRLLDFIQDVQKRWCNDYYDYKHFFYLIEENRVLDSNKTWKENQVISGDHLILY